MSRRPGRILATVQAAARGLSGRSPWWLGMAGLVAGGFWWLGTAGAGTIPSATATIGDLPVGVEVEGVLASRDSSMLTPPSLRSIYNFKIRMMAPEGEEVGEGTPVLAFDTSELERRLRDRQAEAAEAAKNLEKLEADRRQDLLGRELKLAEAEADLRRARLKVDVPEELASALELEIARLELEQARRTVDSLRGQLDAARRQWDARQEVLEAQRARAERQVSETEAAVESMTLEAPRAGTVIWVADWRGEKHKVGDSVWRYEQIIELPDLRTMMAQGEVDEADASRLEVGQPVTLRLDAHPEVEYGGRVESIWRTVQRKSSSSAPLKVVRLDIELDETDTRRMRPGMRFRGSIETRRLEDVLLVPAQAVFPTAEGPVVYRSSLTGWQRVPVEVGERNDTFVEIRSGLEPGDRVAETEPEG